MQYDDFVGTVQSKARLPSRGDAVKAIEATLATLGERLAGGEAEDLAAQLPSELAVFLQGGTATQAFSVDEFFERVAAREEADLPDAAYHARAVIAVLQEAVTTGEVDDVLAQFPESYTPLFEAGTEGETDNSH